MTTWAEVMAGDGQREAENAYMFRRSFTKDFAYLCTLFGDHMPYDAERTKFECYAKDAAGIEWHSPEMTPTEFEALTIDMVGVNTDPPAAEGATVDNTLWAIHDPDLNAYYNRSNNEWVTAIDSATLFTTSEKEPFGDPPTVAGHVNLVWEQHSA